MLSATFYRYALKTESFDDNVDLVKDVNTETGDFNLESLKLVWFIST